MIGAAVAAIQEGLVVGMPTDTVYGVGVDPTRLDAVERLFTLKGRPAHKPIGLLAATAEQVSEIAVLEGVATDLARRHWPGALTLVVRPRVVMPDWVGHAQTRTIGIRVPDHPVTIELLGATGPLAVTSANLSGQGEVLDADTARNVFGDEVAVYLRGICPGGSASTVVDVSGHRPVVIREGPIQI